MDKGYIAGLFDGEGCCLVDKTLKQFSVKITNSDKLVLDSLVPLYGGRVGQKSKKEYGYKTIWDWRLYERQKVFRFLCDLLPHAEIKKTQILCYLTILADVMRGFNKTRREKENLQWCYERFVAIRIGDRYDGGSDVLSECEVGADEGGQAEETHESPETGGSFIGTTDTGQFTLSRVRPVLPVYPSPLLGGGGRGGGTHFHTAWAG